MRGSEDIAQPSLMWSSEYGRGSLRNGIVIADNRASLGAVMSRICRRVLVVTALLGAMILSPPAQAAPCASPIEPGPWSGAMLWTRNVAHPMVLVQIVDGGELTIDVAC